MNAEGIGIASVMLGAGRENKDSVVDSSAGIILKKKYAERVNKGETLAVFYASDEKLFKEAENKFLSSIIIEADEPQKRPLILAKIGRDGEEELYK